MSITVTGDPGASSTSSSSSPRSFPPTPAAPSVGHVAADPDDLHRFVDRGGRYRAALQAGHERVLTARRRTVASLGADTPPDLASPAVEALLARAIEVDEHVRAVVRALLEASAVGCRPALRRAIVEGRLPAPDDAVREEVLAAVLAGLTPDDSGLDPAYFPAEYLRHLDLGRRIEEAESQREVADGRSWMWWDGDDAALAAIDEELARLRDRRLTLVEHGLAPDGSIDTFDAVALVAEATAGEAWEGAVYGSAFARHHERGIADGGLFGRGAGALERPRGFDVELDHLAERVADDAEVALAFYERLGPELTADLPTFVIGADGPGDAEGDRITLAALSRGLGAASRLVGPLGQRLGFGGDELLAQPRRSTQPGVVGYSPALLFTDGEFDDAFLAAAAATTLQLADDGDPRGLSTHWGWDVVGLFGGGRVSYDGGEEPRNILLARVGERGEAARLVIEELTERAGDGPGALDSLLRPSVPFSPTLGPDPAGGHWLDRFDELADLHDLGNVADPDHGALSPIGYPPLADPYPITGFLVAVAADPESSRRVLSSVAASVAVSGETVGDLGTAAGLDLMLGAHAATMVPAESLAVLGIEPAALNIGAESPVEAEHWRAVHGEVLRWGRGEALAAGAEELLGRAVQGSVRADGRVEIDAFAPIAHAAGRAQAEAYGALLAYAATLDDEARRRNRLANRSVAVATTAVGLLPGGWLVSGPTSLGWAWFFDGYPDEHEITEHREAWRNEFREVDPFRWKKLAAAAYIETQLGPDGMAHLPIVIPDLGTEVVPVRPTDDPLGFEWRHPETDRWKTLTPVDDGAHHQLPHHDPSRLRQVVSAADEVSENHLDGVRAAGYGLDELGDDWSELPESLRDAGWTSDWMGRS